MAVWAGRYQGQQRQRHLMALSPDQIIPEIRSGRCRKASIPDFQNDCYFADAEGNVYSLNNPREPKSVDQKIGNGLMWVALFEKEGYIRKIMVGDIIANTFLDDVDHDESESTVVYLDGNCRNNAASNLRWGTPQEQQNMLRQSQLDKVQDKEPINGRKKEEKAATEDLVPFVAKKEEDPLLDQLHLLQARLERAQTRESKLLDALAPFASFKLSPAQAVDVGTAIVLESNRGSNNHSRLTVQDFRVAKTVLDGNDDREGSKGDKEKAS